MKFLTLTAMAAILLATANGPANAHEYGQFSQIYVNPSYSGVIPGYAAVNPGYYNPYGYNNSWGDVRHARQAQRHAQNAWRHAQLDMMYASPEHAREAVHHAIEDSHHAMDDTNQTQYGFNGYGGY